MIAPILRDLRQSAGYKQVYLAKRLGISQSHLCNLEKGRTNASLEILECYATFFGKGSITEAITNTLR
jgi:transcriptional regulator with XRE-family HTH domain